MRMTPSKGFTLIELMIVVVIIGILAAIAYPAYTGYAQKARRSDAKHALLDMQLNQEKWRANNVTYSSSLTELGWADGESLDGYYDLSVTGSPTTYWITARANAGLQANDTNCLTMKLNESHDKESYDSSSTETFNCW